MTPERVQSALRAKGRQMTLRRRVGTTSTFVDQTVYGTSEGFQPNELTGGVVQGDRRIRISPLDMGTWPGAVPVGVQASQWPAKIKAGDILDGATVQGAELRHIGGEPAVWVCWVRG